MGRRGEREMQADASDWTELREFERCEPGTLAFRALAGLLETWPGDDQSAAIEAAERILEDWPDELRLAPWSWCKAASKGHVPRTWRLVRNLQLTSDHLSKGHVRLTRLAKSASLDRVTHLTLPAYSPDHEISFLYYRPEVFPALKSLAAADKTGDGEIRALAESPLWNTLQSFSVGSLTASLAHQDVSRIVPRWTRPEQIGHLTLRAADLIAVWEAHSLPRLSSASVFIRSIDEARALAERPELARLTSLSIAFRCGFSGSSPFEPFLGNVIEADEEAAVEFFRRASLNRLEGLTIAGYTMGYWGREGLGHLGLEGLVACGVLSRLKALRLERLPLGDRGVEALSPALGPQLESLELVDIYCKQEGAIALSHSPGLRSLKRLDLSGNRIDSAGAIALSRVEMPQLRELELSGPPINPYYWNVGQQPLLDAGALAWSESHSARGLTMLGLANCYLTDDSLIAVFQSPFLSRVETIDLSHNAFTAAGVSKTATSERWHTLKSVELNHCRLDNAAIESLTEVREAPVLRELELGYNSIGAAGAAALARWPVLANLWRLHLHDNFIGDAGLVALAQSPHASRLVELDLEQDCWNSHGFTFDDTTARRVAESSHLARLDGLFSGEVDEYHGAAYGVGFTKAGLEIVRNAAWGRPAFRATISDFSKIHDYFEEGPFDEEAELQEGDFRNHPFSLNDREAEGTAHNMRQLPTPRREEANDEERPPQILSELPTENDVDGDQVEGIGFRDPRLRFDESYAMALSLEDPDRPLPGQSGKYLSDTLGSLLQATGLGTIDSTGASSRLNADGQYVPTRMAYAVGLSRTPEPALRLIREVLWWVGAPERTELKEHPLSLATPPATRSTRYLQLAELKVVRWQRGGDSGHRLDRVPFSASRRQRILDLLESSGGTESRAGWTEVTSRDGGRVSICTRSLADSGEFESLNIIVEVLSPQGCQLVHQLMLECGLLLLPMNFAASDEAASTLDCDWPDVTVVESATLLHELLSRGPYAWWRDQSPT